MAADEWYQTTVHSIEEVGKDYFYIQLKAPKEFQHQAGQYTIFELEDSDGSFPCYYSIASSPKSNGIIDFCIMNKDGSRSTAIYRNMKAGDEVKVASPKGKFGLSGAKGPKVFVAGGSGISPIRAMIQSLIEAGNSDDPVHLIYGCRSSDSVPFSQEFQGLSESQAHFNQWICVESGENNGYKSGRVTEFLDEAYVQGSEFYLCGPPPMVKAVQNHLEQVQKLGPESVHVESY